MGNETAEGKITTAEALKKIRALSRETGVLANVYLSTRDAKRRALEGRDPRTLSPVDQAWARHFEDLERLGGSGR